MIDVRALSPVYQMGLVVLGLLIISTVITFALKKAKPAKNFSELSSRVNSWWIMATVFFAAVVVNEHISIIFFAFMSFWALKEFVTLLKTRQSDHKTLVLAFLAIPVQYYWVWDRWYGMFIIFIPVYMFLVIPSRLVLSSETAGFVASASQIQWGLMAFVFGLSQLAFLLQLEFIPGTPPEVDGRTLLLFLVFVVEISDVLQYVWGKLLGRHKVIPQVSPNKTWEGLIGGMATAILLSLGLRFLTPFTIGETLFVSFLITLAGFLGGAVMSAVKRDFGVKDFGAAIPGHGGMLDRVDSLCWAAPVFFHWVRYFHVP
jgi:phosphatidate cytidylyltransferase